MLLFGAACGMPFEKSRAGDWTAYFNSSRTLKNCNERFHISHIMVFTFVFLWWFLYHSTFSKTTCSRLVKKSTNHESEFLKPLLLELVKRLWYANFLFSLLVEEMDACPLYMDTSIYLISKIIQFVTDCQGPASTNKGMTQRKFS